jgi:hypothetical protein
MELSKNTRKKNALVFSKPGFKKVADFLKDRDDIAFISIESTEECARYWLEQEKGDYDNEHYLPGGPRVLNLEFDDLMSDREYQGHIFRSISGEQAREIVDFIDKNFGRHFIIHCKSGVSRSQGVFRYILDTFPEFYEETEYNQDNPCITPNYTVVTSLKSAYREKWVEDYGPVLHPWFDPSLLVHRLLKTYNEHGTLVIGYDFDGTIYDTNGVGGDFSPIIDLLRKCTRIGFRMCMWTAELDPKQLSWKIEYAKEQGIGVDYVNESPLMPGTKKPYFNILLDDRAGLSISYKTLLRTFEILTNDYNDEI